MSEIRQDTDTQAPNVEVESLRYLSKDGKTGTLSVVVGGVHHLFPCRMSKAFTFIASVGEAAAKRDG